MSAVDDAGVVVPKGLKSGAIGLVESTGIGVASTAPAYSLAVTLGFVVAIIGVQTPLLVVLAFVPMLFLAWATKLMNRIDPDCGTSFTWAARALGPRTGWFAGGFGTIASDFLAMGSYAQIAGQYMFLLVGADVIGQNPTSPWVLLVGVLWIVGLTYICYRGIEISARLQMWLVSIEIVILLVTAAVAVIRLASGSAPAGHIPLSWSWLNPTKIASFSAFMQGMLLMVFIYWGWDTTTSINEETEDSSRVPGLAGVISTFLLLGTYFFVIVAMQAYVGVGTSGYGLGNAAHAGDVLSILGAEIYGNSVIGTIMSHLLIFMVLTSAAATTQTTILPNARTMLSMSFHKALDGRFGRTHPVYMTPTVATVSFGVASVVYYVALNFLAHGNVIADSVTGTTFFAALYLGITALACAWHYRGAIHRGVRAAVSELIVPALGFLMIYAILAWSFKIYADPSQSYFELNLPVFGEVGGVMLTVVVSTLVGLAWMLFSQRQFPAFFRGEMHAHSLTDDDEVVAVRFE